MAVEELEIAGELIRLELLQKRGAARVFRARFLRQAVYEIRAARYADEVEPAIDHVHAWGDFHAMALVDVPPEGWDYRASTKAAAMARALALVRRCFRRIATGAEQPRRIRAV